MVPNAIPPPKILLSTVKRNIMVGKMCSYCIALAFLHIALNASQKLFDSVVINFLFGLIVAFGYLLNYRKHHRTSKLFVLFFLNLLCFFYTSVLPEQTGAFLYFFPLIVASSALFDSDEKAYEYFFIILPLALLLIMVFVEYKFLLGYSFKPPLNNSAFFAVNAFSSAALTILLVNFMQRLNASSEKELKQLAEEVNGKNIHLEKTNAELDRFLYSTSHDLRSPLSSIKGLVNIARKETAEEKTHKYFEMMIDRVNKLDFFIKDIIDYSKNARTDVRNEPVDFNLLLTEVTENLKYIEGAESIRFVTKVSFAQPVNADKTRLSVVLNNLIANAIKYHDPHKEKQWIDVQVTNSDGTVKVNISDNGTGIDPEHQTKIFDMFYRGTFQSKGSGLGLYIVKETLAKMSGSIHVESSPGKGSSFHITFPAS